MKQYKLVPQERDNYCICSALQAIFQAHGISVSQKEIADNLTPDKKGFHVDDEKIKGFLREKGFEYLYYWYNETPFNEQDMVLRDIYENEGIVGVNSHVYLLKAFNDPILELIDPENSAIKRKDIYNILRDMEKGGGFFGLIKKLQ